MRRCLLLLLLPLFTLSVNAQGTVEIDGFWYFLSSTGEAKLTWGFPSYSVVIPETVSHRGTPYKVTSIDSKAFYYQYGDCIMKSLTIPNSVTSIGERAFFRNYGLTSLTIPNSVTSIGTMAFVGCSGLTSVTIPNSITILDCTFGSCSGLTSVVIPNSVTRIVGAFSNCSGLTSVNIPNSVTEIGDYAFEGCYSLTSVTIPNSVTSIGEWAFYGCGGLTSVTIGSGVTSIGDNAFYLCQGLTSISIPNSVTTIGNFAFCGCSGLTSVNIPNSVTMIGYTAFANCSELTSITIPNKLTRILKSTFRDCIKLADVYCLAEKVPDTASNAFEGSPIDQATLHVPEQSIDAYKAVFPWNKFKNIVGEATGITRIHNDPVQVHHDNGHITVEGVEEGTAVSVYDIKGVQIGSSIVEGGQVSIPTNLQTGSIAIVKIKDKSIKVTIK